MLASRRQTKSFGLRQGVRWVGIILTLIAVVSCSTATPAAPTAAPTSAPATSTAQPTLAPQPATQAPGATATTGTEVEVTEPATVPTGGTVVLSWNTDANSLAPYHQTLSIERALASHIFDSLVAFDEVNKAFVPALATSWSTNDDGTQWTFELRQDVTFHDGTPFNAEAVKFTFDWILDEASQAAPFTRGFLAGYASSEVIDEYTVQVNFSAPPGRFLDGLVTANLGILSPTAVQELGDDFSSNPVGTGPFMFEEWVPNDHITLVRNPDYSWGASGYSHEGVPYIDAIEFRPIREDATRSTALETGEITFAYLSFADAPRFRDVDGITLILAPRPGTVRAINFNTVGGPASDVLGDVDVRRAIGYAVDRNAIAGAPFFGGAALPALTPLSPVMFGYQSELEELALPYDPDMARQILDAAGWVPGSDGIRVKDGQRLSLIHGNPNLTFLGEVGQLLQSQLRDVGIDVVLELQPDWTTFLPLIQEGKYDTMIGGSFVADMGLLNTNFDPGQIGKSPLVFARYESDELAALLQEGSATIDPDERLRIYGDVQRLIMENVVVVPLYVEPYVFAHLSGLQGVRYNINGEPRFHDAYFQP